ncbi:MAG: serine/threonine-protein kinase, partial [Isosphaeraceae bacterium]
MSQDQRDETSSGSEPDDGAATLDDSSTPDSPELLTITQSAETTLTIGSVCRPTALDLTLDADSATAPPKRAAPAVPGYEVFGELGRGGAGVVYLARHLMLNRVCALKMILAGAHADAVQSIRFLGEAEAVARLQHPNIIQIHHIGEAGGLPFLELEYVDGGSLDTCLDGTPWPARRAADLVEHLARAVAEAHRLGIIHRDLKPANVLMTADGTPKITDFGLAKTLSIDSGLTRTESIMGSPAYMAPEQAEGHAKDVGPLADVYALGVILYELLTGRPPFQAPTVLQVLEQVKTTEPVPPSRLVPGVPRDMETIALKCLEKVASRRYGSAEALAEDLGRFLAGRPIQARRVSPFERSWRWYRRNPLVASLAAAVLVLLLAVAVVALNAANRERQARIKEQRTANRERQARIASEADRARLIRAETALNRARSREEILRRMTEVHRLAFEQAPTLVARQNLDNSYQTLAATLRTSGRKMEAAAIQRQRQALWSGHADKLFEQAAQQARFATEDGSQPTADQALRFLKQIVLHPPSDLPGLAQAIRAEPAFAALRSRTDLQQILKALDANDVESGELRQFRG